MLKIYTGINGKILKKWVAAVSPGTSSFFLSQRSDVLFAYYRVAKNVCVPEKGGGGICSNFEPKLHCMLNARKRDFLGSPFQQLWGGGGNL